MSNKHRLMKIVEIEKNYHKHRERLLSIQHINSRQKQYVSSLAPSPASAAYKQSRLKADLFAYKSRTKDIQRENKILI